MTSLLPEPFGRGARNNINKRKYILDYIQNIEYRTIAILDEIEMKVFEKKIKRQKKHIFNTFFLKKLLFSIFSFRRIITSRN